ncbi:MAG: phosphoglycerate kinase [Candidatus Omnitrophica bacterium]|nr:phosphoglycerate kinase [Candidatus Omnitrophota bacterium]
MGQKIARKMREKIVVAVLFLSLITHDLAFVYGLDMLRPPRLQTDDRSYDLMENLQPDNHYDGGDFSVRTIEELKQQAKKVKADTVIVGVDWNVARKKDKITDDKRIINSLATLKELSQFPYLFILSHSGRPQGKGFEEDLSMKPIAARAQELVNQEKMDVEVVYLPYTDDLKETANLVKKIKEKKQTKQIWFVLDNVRFWAQEKSKDKAVRLAFEKELLAITGKNPQELFYVNEAFDKIHRGQEASMELVNLIPAENRAAGLQLEKEIAKVLAFKKDVTGTLSAVFGGAKFDKYKNIAGLAKKVAHSNGKIIIVGALANPFLKKEGIEIGKSKMPTKGSEYKVIEQAITKIKEAKADVLLPIDFNVKGTVQKRLTQDMAQIDIGPETIQAITSYIDSLKPGDGIILNGGTGIFENEQSREGTRQLILAAERAAQRGVIVFAAGGDMNAAMNIIEKELKRPLSRAILRSTGGGALLTMLANEIDEVPAFSALLKNDGGVLSATPQVERLISGIIQRYRTLADNERLTLTLDEKKALLWKLANLTKSKEDYQVYSNIRRIISYLRPKEIEDLKNLSRTEEIMAWNRNLPQAVELCAKPINIFVSAGNALIFRAGALGLFYNQNYQPNVNIVAIKSLRGRKELSAKEFVELNSHYTGVFQPYQISGLRLGTPVEVNGLRIDTIIIPEDKNIGRPEQTIYYFDGKVDWDQAFDALKALGVDIDIIAEYGPGSEEAGRNQPSRIRKFIERGFRVVAASPFNTKGTRQQLTQFFMEKDPFLSKEQALQKAQEAVKEGLYAVNRADMDESTLVVDTLTCTSNAMTAAFAAVHENFKVVKGSGITVHSATDSNETFPGKSGRSREPIDLLRGFSIVNNIQPASTGAAKNIFKIYPEMEGKLNISAVRVGTWAGSFFSMTLEVEKKVTKEEVRAKIKEFVEKQADGAMKFYEGIEDQTESPLETNSIIGWPEVSIIDGFLIDVVGDGHLVVIQGFYDNQSAAPNQIVSLWAPWMVDGDRFRKITETHRDGGTIAYGRIIFSDNHVDLGSGPVTGSHNIKHAIAEAADGVLINHSEARLFLETTLEAKIRAILAQLRAAEDKKQAQKMIEKDFSSFLKTLTNLPEKAIEEILTWLPELFSVQPEKEDLLVERLYRRITNKVMNTILKEIINESSTYRFREVQVCVGETKAQYDAKRTREVIFEDLAEILDEVTPEQAKKINLIFAYEPRWAIGTGLIPDPQSEIEPIHEFITQTVKMLIGIQAFVDYGGSLNEDNMDEILSLPHVSGGLIGSAAKTPQSILPIIEKAIEVGKKKKMIMHIGMNHKAETTDTGLSPYQEFAEAFKYLDLSRVNITIGTPTVKATRDALLTPMVDWQRSLEILAGKLRTNVARLRAMLALDKDIYDVTGGRALDKMIKELLKPQFFVEKIKDSRGKDTVRVRLTTLSGLSAIGEVPAGASTGADEARTVEVEQALANIMEKIMPMINSAGLDLRRHQDLLKAEDMIIAAAGENFERLGANATVPVSWALWQLAAQLHGMSLAEYIRTFEKEAVYHDPVYFYSNIYNGGLHAIKEGEKLGVDRIDIQEIMTVVIKPGLSYAQRLAAQDRIQLELRKLLVDEYGEEALEIGDEAGFTVKGLGSSEEAFALVAQAIINAGFRPGKDVKLALDPAATSFYNERENVYEFQGKKLTSSEMIEFYVNLAKKYPGLILSIEDGLAENDWQAWSEFTRQMEKYGIMTIGDDIFVTQMQRLSRGVREKAAHAILIKVNQNGSLRSTLEVIKYAKANGMKIIISHRSGETLYSGIADLAEAVGAFGIKTGATQPEKIFNKKDTWVRRNKYLRLVELEQNKKIDLKNVALLVSTTYLENPAALKALESVCGIPNIHLVLIGEKAERYKMLLDEESIVAVDTFNKAAQYLKNLAQKPERVVLLTQKGDELNQLEGIDCVIVGRGQTVSLEVAKALVTLFPHKSVRDIFENFLKELSQQVIVEPNQNTFQALLEEIKQGTFELPSDIRLQEKISQKVERAKQQMEIFVTNI